MKTLTNIIRYITGALFVFSGLVKAIDPHGLAYKMQEFFEVWSKSGALPKFMEWLSEYSLQLSFFMNTLEIVAGAALIVGWKSKITTRVLFLLVCFFTFLTAYVLFSGKIKACGCFGDCIPLTPTQTFVKDIILLLFCLLLVINYKYIKPLFKGTGIFVFIVFVVAILIQVLALNRGAIVDCLPYKKGNNIDSLMQMPPNAVPDTYDYVFVYSKGNQTQSFKADSLPDSSWTFVDRKNVLIQKGSNNLPVIPDFSLTTSSGNDSTKAILTQKGIYYLVFVIQPDKLNKTDYQNLQKLITQTQFSKENLYLVSAQAKNLEESLQKNLPNETGKYEILSCDGVVIKTVSRTNATVYQMEGPVVENKTALRYY